jgi:hypothetical protein
LNGAFEGGHRIFRRVSGSSAVRDDPGFAHVRRYPSRFPRHDCPSAAGPVPDCQPRRGTQDCKAAMISCMWQSVTNMQILAQ